jgi:hypothetical protein
MMQISAKAMRGKTLALAIAAAAAALTLAGTGLASASPSPSASGTEQFYLSTTSATATTMPVIAAGVFTAAGVDHAGNSVDTLKFANGSFQIIHPGPGTGHPKFNPKTCFVTFTGTGKFTLGHGTGAYKGISGSGKVAVTFVAIGARTHSGACSKNAPPVAFQQSLRGTAHLKL